MPEVEPAVATLVAQAAERLGGAGVRDARREALGIWAGLRGTTSADVFLHSREAADPEDSAKFFSLVERRSRGEPLAYVTGWAGFRWLALRSDPRPQRKFLRDHCRRIFQRWHSVSADGTRRRSRCDS